MDRSDKVLYRIRCLTYVQDDKIKLVTVKLFKMKTEAFPAHSIIIIQPQNAESSAFNVALGLMASVIFL